MLFIVPRDLHCSKMFLIAGTQGFLFCQQTPIYFWKPQTKVMLWTIFPTTVESNSPNVVVFEPCKYALNNIYTAPATCLRMLPKLLIWLRYIPLSSLPLFSLSQKVLYGINWTVQTSLWITGNWLYNDQKSVPKDSSQKKILWLLVF